MRQMRTNPMHYIHHTYNNCTLSDQYIHDISQLFSLCAIILDAYDTQCITLKLHYQNCVHSKCSFQDILETDHLAIHISDKPSPMIFTSYSIIMGYLTFSHLMCYINDTLHVLQTLFYS